MFVRETNKKKCRGFSTINLRQTINQFHQSSVASIFLSISLLMVQASQPHIIVDHTHALINLLRKLKNMDLFATKAWTLLNAFLAIATRVFIY